MPIPRLTSAIRLDPRRAIVAAAVFHLLVTLTIFGVGRFGLFPAQFDRAGIGEFARDSRHFAEQSSSLADELIAGNIGAWTSDSATFHVKMYSLDLVLMRPLLGTSIVAVEPLNLLYYLAIVILVFRLTCVVAGRPAAWFAAALVGLWPSFLLHTTQLIRDPLLITAILILVLVLGRLLIETHTWRSASTAGIVGVPACFVIWLCRPDMWLVIMAIMVIAIGLLIFRILRDRKLLVWNLALLCLLCVLTMVIIPWIPHQPKERAAGTSRAIVRRYQDGSIWSRIAAVRDNFILEGVGDSGSIIDPEVSFSSRSDVFKYIPRALEIGFLAPFPSMWFSPGQKVGLPGRLLSGIESLATYAIEVLACIFVWRKRRRLDVWLLVLIVGTGLVALGMVVVNVGTLYRMRYPFWMLMVVMAASILAGWFTATPSGPRAIQSQDLPEH